MRGPVRQRSWNQRTRSAAQHTRASPAASASKAVKGNPGGAGVFESGDVLFDVGVGAHVGVEDGGVAFLVGVVAPVAPLFGGEQRLLGALVAGFAAHDQPGAWRPSGEVDGVGELGDERVVT